MKAALKLALDALQDFDYAKRIAAIAAAKQALAQPDQPGGEAMTDFDMRGLLASELTCWHRLTEAESSELVEFFSIMKNPPAMG